jgi:hypothetical protein
MAYRPLRTAPPLDRSQELVGTQQPGIYLVRPSDSTPGFLSIDVLVSRADNERPFEVESGRVRVTFVRGPNPCARFTLVDENNQALMEPQWDFSVILTEVYNRLESRPPAGPHAFNPHKPFAPPGGYIKRYKLRSGSHAPPPDFFHAVGRSGTDGPRGASHAMVVQPGRVMGANSGGCLAGFLDSIPPDASGQQSSVLPMEIERESSHTSSGQATTVTREGEEGKMEDVEILLLPTPTMRTTSTDSFNEFISEFLFEEDGT